MDTEKRGSADTVRECEMSESILERTPARFWRKVDKNGPMPEHRPELGPCWLWIAGLQTDGYGIFRIKKPKWRWAVAHRWSYENFRGAIPFGLTLDHLCRVRLCVNPQHLEPVTNRENILRGIGVTAKNARKTHCKRGHSFDEENIYHRPGKNGRACRMCRKTGR